MQYATGKGVVSARQHTSNKTAVQCAHRTNNLGLVKDPQVTHSFVFGCRVKLTTCN